MEGRKIFFAPNIKFLRERKRLGQEALAEKLSLTRSKLNALENGQTKAPQPEDLIRFSEFFRISIDSLLKVDLHRLSELKLRELEAGNDVYMMGSRIRVLAITVDSDNRENMEYVPVKAKAGYRSGYNDPEFIAALPKFTAPNLPAGGTYRMFPTTGDSMHPIPEGSDVIARYVADWKSLKPGSLCIVILRGDQDFVFKEVTVGSDGMVVLRSLNPLFEPYSVSAEDILEIWQYHAYQTRSIPEQPAELDEIREMIRDLRADLKQKK